MSYVHRDEFTSSFPVLMISIDFSCPTAQAWTSSTLSHTHGESGPHRLVRDPSVMLAVAFPYMGFIILRYDPLLSLWSIFILEELRMLPGACSVFIEVIAVSMLPSVGVLGHVDLHRLNLPEADPMCSWCTILSMRC